TLAEASRVDLAGRRSPVGAISCLRWIAVSRPYFTRADTAVATTAMTPPSPHSHEIASVADGPTRRRGGGESGSLKKANTPISRKPAASTGFPLETAKNAKVAKADSQSQRLLPGV